jgi:predicted amidohydrolase
LQSIRVGLGQIRVEGGKPAANLERGVNAIRDAARQGCNVVVLPECMDLGWTDPSARTLAEPIPGPRSAQLSAAAKTHGVYVAVGLVERAGSQCFNSAVLIAPDGEIVLHHRKINELDLAHDLYAIGDRLGVAQTSLGTVGLDICADNFGSSLAIGHVLARMGAHIILSPASWAVEAAHDNQREPYGGLWRDAYCKLAKLYEIPIIGVSNVGWISGGPWQGRKCIGCSLAVSAEGAVIAEGPYGVDAEALLCIDVPLYPRRAAGTQWTDALRAKGYEGP